MIKDMIPELKTRAEQIQNRLKALMEETSNLNLEYAHVEPLLRHYLALGYDPIEEERRVTKAILDIPDPAKEPAKPKHYGGKPKGTSQYDIPIQIIFEEANGEPRTTQEIHKSLILLTGKNITATNSWQVVKQQVLKGNLKQSAWGQYTWIGGKFDARTTPVPTGRRELPEKV